MKYGGSTFLSSSVVFANLILTLVFATIEKNDGSSAFVEELRPEQHSLLPRDQTSSSLTSQTSLLTVTFNSNFTIAPITYTPTGTPCSGFSSLKFLVVFSSTLTTLTTTFQGETIVYSTTIYLPVPTDNSIFQNNPTGNQFTLTAITYTPTCNPPHPLILSHPCIMPSVLYFFRSVM